MEKQDLNQNNQVININVPKGEEGGKWGTFFKYGKNLITTIANASILRIIKVIGTLFSAGVLILILYVCFTNSSKINLLIANNEEDNMNMTIRDKTTRKINDELDKIMYSMKADRIVVFEFHNGKENATRLPFRYVDMSYERISEYNDSVKYVSDKFQNLCLTHYELPYYVADNNFFLGSKEEIKKIDGRFYQYMSENGGNYIGSYILRSNGTDIGTLCVFYDYENYPTEGVENMKKYLKQGAKVISALLDLEVQKPIYHDNTD